MSEKALAELLDDLVAKDLASIAESPAHVVASGLSVNSATAVQTLANALGWPAQVFDQESTPWNVGSLDASLEPFRIVIDKPSSPDGVRSVLTDTAFAQWLDEGAPQGRWRVARLSASISTWGVLFEPWDGTDDFVAKNETKSPRSLVREYGPGRLAPSDIRPWLLRSTTGVDRSDSAFLVWADRSAVALAQSMPNEIDSEDKTLKFTGPPRLALASIDKSEGAFRRLGISGFGALQQLIAWVFEVEREAEMRHLLAATEIAQSGGSETDALACLAKFARSALEGARIAYQLSLADVSKESLKLLGDLRKAVIEEVGKLTDQTRQLVAAMTGALAVGIGLLAARLTTPAPPLLLTAVMLVVAAHIALAIWAGWRFIKLQNALRSDWQPRLYRFLPSADYERMVTGPVQRAEGAFKRSAWWCSLITTALLVVVIVMSWSAENATSDGRTSPRSKASSVESRSEAKQDPRPAAPEGQAKQAPAAAPQLREPQGAPISKEMAPQNTPADR